MKPFLSACLLFFLSLAASAQKEATHWYFGPKLGFDFTKRVPQILRNSTMVAGRGCATISDKITGELLFYTNGRNIWNRLHERMSGSKLFADTCGSGLQGALIVPAPGKSTQYYLFSLFIINKGRPYTENPCAGDLADFFVQDTANYFELRYSVIDMRLDGGRGDLVTDSVNLFLGNNLATKLTAVPHANGKDYWLITHGWNSRSFFTYPVTGTGVGSPVEQAIGSSYQWYVQGDQLYSDEIVGEVKASPDGSMLACAVHNLRPRPFDVFDFDPATGRISNYRSYGDIAQQTGVSFSPDNSKLYVTSGNRVDQSNFLELLRQYDLSLPTSGQRIASGQGIIRFNPNTNIRPGSHYPLDVVFTTLHITPNGNIYGKGGGSTQNNGGENDVLVVSEPNRTGFDCGVNMQRFGFGLPDNKGSFRSFPNFIQAYFNNIPSGQSGKCDFSGLLLYPNPAREQVVLGPSCLVPTRVEIIDALGRIVDIQYLYSTVVNVGHLSDGMYTLKIFSTDNIFITKKLIKI